MEGARQLGFFSRFDFDRYDVIHTHGLRPDAFTFFRRPLSTTASFLTTLHSYIDQDLKSIYGRVRGGVFFRAWLFLLKRHDLIVVLSGHGERYFSRFLRQDRLTHAYNGTDAPEAHSSPPVIVKASGEILIGTVSRIVRIKGLEQVIHLLKFNPKIRYVCVGDGPELPALKRLAEDLGVSDRCHFLGFHKDVGAFYTAFDVFVFPSRSEGSPIALMEALSLGVSCVCSDIPVFREMAGDSVKYYSLDDVEAFSKAVEFASVDRVSMHRRAIAIYEEKFTTGKMAERYLDLYRRLKKARHDRLAFRIDQPSI